MIREKAKEICEMIETHGIEVIKAYGEGKTIQHLNLDGEWVDCDMPISFSNNHSFRIKAELSKEINERMTKEELEKENAELKCECRRCVYTDCPCVLPDYGKDKNGICDHFKDVFDENAELKADNTEWEKASDKWKNIYELTNNQLANAKEILRLFLDANDNLEMINAQRKAEQFLNSEVEK